MKYYYIEPECPGDWGDGTIANTDVHPPIVIKLHYEFIFWSDDVLLQTFPVYIVTEKARRLLVSLKATGIEFDRVVVSPGDQFHLITPGIKLPKYAWLRVNGVPGVDDFGLSSEHELVISGRALRALKGLHLSGASTTPYDGR